MNDNEAYDQIVAHAATIIDDRVRTMYNEQLDNARDLLADPFFAFVNNDGSVTQTQLNKLIEFMMSNAHVEAIVEQRIERMTGETCDYVAHNDDGSFTVMLYETQRELTVSLAITDISLNDRSVRELINDATHTV